MKHFPAFLALAVFLGTVSQPAVGGAPSPSVACDLAGTLVRADLTESKAEPLLLSINSGRGREHYLIAARSRGLLSTRLTAQPEGQEWHAVSCTIETTNPRYVHLAKRACAAERPTIAMDNGAYADFVAIGRAGDRAVLRIHIGDFKMFRSGDLSLRGLVAAVASGKTILVKQSLAGLEPAVVDIPFTLPRGFTGTIDFGIIQDHEFTRTGSVCL